jgi:hypothetical protein
VSERWCKRCQKTLPLEAFNRYKDGYQWWCRECFKVYFRERGKLHIDQVNASRDARRERAHAHVLSYLVRELSPPEDLSGSQQLPPPREEAS